MVWCPNCDHYAEGDARFCSRCGTVLPRRRCQGCGTPNPLEAMRCRECGQPLRTVAVPAEPAPPAEEPNPSTSGPLARLAELSAATGRGPLSGLVHTAPPPASPPSPAPSPAPAPALTPAAAPSTPVETTADAFLRTVVGKVVASLPTHTEGLQAGTHGPPATPPHAAPSTAAAPVAPAAGLPAPLAPGEEEATKEGTDAAAVDLYIDVFSSAAPPRAAEPAALPRIDFELPLMSASRNAEPYGAIEPPRAPRWAAFALYGIGAVAIGAGVLIAGGSSWFPRSSPAREVREMRPPAGPATELAPDRAAPAATLPRDGAMAPTTRAPGALPPTAGASAATGPRRAGGTDAAADAALEAAERLLAAPRGTATAPARRAAAPRAAATPSGSASDAGITPPARTPSQ